MRLPLLNRLLTLGLILFDDADNQKVYMKGCHEGTAANRLKRWRSRIRYSTLRVVNGQKVTSTEQVKQIIDATRNTSQRFVDFVFARTEARAQPDDN